MEVHGKMIVNTNDLTNHAVKSYSLCEPPGPLGIKLMDSWSDTWHGGYATVTIRGVTTNIGDPPRGTNVIVVDEPELTFAAAGPLSPAPSSPPCVPVSMTIVAKSWASEIKVDVRGNTVVPAGSIHDRTTTSHDLGCLTAGPLGATLMDTYGDGWHDGYATVTIGNGTPVNIGHPPPGLRPPHGKVVNEPEVVLGAVKANKLAARRASPVLSPA